MVMTLFIFSAASLVLIALSFALYPIIKTQRKLTLVIILGLPLLTFALYCHVGAPQAIDNVQIAAAKTIPDLDTAMSGLKAELKNNPDNVEGWVLLARTQMTMGNFAEANAAFEKAITLQPDNPDLKTEFAEALLRSSEDRTFPPQAIQLLEQALAENPEHERAMFFMGMHLLQQGDDEKAESYLTRLLPKLDSDTANELRLQINVARARQNKPPLEIPKTEINAEVTAPTISLKVNISIDGALASAVKPGAVLFVFAKSVNGGGPPVAAKRIEVSTFPVQLELSDADSLMPTANLSSQKKVALSARISLQGIANAQAGDIEADAVIVDTSASKPVEIKLWRVKQ
jgi:cytochrome c-type biogenesis protein CcmH